MDSRHADVKKPLDSIAHHRCRQRRLFRDRDIRSAGADDEHNALAGYFYRFFRPSRSAGTLVKL